RAGRRAIAEVALVEQVPHLKRELPARREAMLELGVGQRVLGLLPREGIRLIVIEALSADVTHVEVRAAARREAPRGARSREPFRNDRHRLAADIDAAVDPRAKARLLEGEPGTQIERGRGLPQRLELKPASLGRREIDVRERERAEVNLIVEADLVNACAQPQPSVLILEA